MKYSQSDWNKLRQELELNFQAQLLAKEREWSGKLADRDARLATLDDGNRKLRQTNEDMRLAEWMYLHVTLIGRKQFGSFSQVVCKGSCHSFIARISTSWVSCLGCLFTSSTTSTGIGVAMDNGNC